MQNGKAEQPVWTRTANGANKILVLHVRLRCGSLSITTPVSLLANEIDARSVLHWQVSLAAVNQIYVIHEAMNGCKNSTDSLKACFENLNIPTYTSACMDATCNICHWLFFALSGSWTLGRRYYFVKQVSKLIISIFINIFHFDSWTQNQHGGLKARISDFDTSCGCYIYSLQCHRISWKFDRSIHIWLPLSKHPFSVSCHSTKFCWLYQLLFDGTHGNRVRMVLVWSTVWAALQS